MKLTKILHVQLGTGLYLGYRTNDVSEQTNFVKNEDRFDEIQPWILGANVHLGLGVQYQRWFAGVNIEAENSLGFDVSHQNLIGGDKVWLQFFKKHNVLDVRASKKRPNQALFFVFCVLNIDSIAKREINLVNVRR